MGVDNLTGVGVGYMVGEKYGFFMKCGGAGVYICARAARRRASAWVGVPGRGRTHTLAHTRARRDRTHARTHERTQARCE